MSHREQFNPGHWPPQSLSKGEICHFSCPNDWTHCVEFDNFSSGSCHFFFLLVENRKVYITIYTKKKKRKKERKKERKKRKKALFESLVSLRRLGWCSPRSCCKPRLGHPEQPGQRASPALGCVASQAYCGTEETCWHTAVFRLCQRHVARMRRLGTSYKQTGPLMTRLPNRRAF